MRVRRSSWGLMACAAALTSAAMLKPGIGQEPATKAPAAQQESASAPAEKTTRKKSRGRLPNYYGRIGLTDAQREKIYGIQSKYRVQIEELEKQIMALQTKENEEIVAVLSPVQQELLQKLQDEAKKRREERARKRREAETSSEQ